MRLAITSKNKGKSGGARVISYFYQTAETIYLLSIYDKSETENITDAELKELIKEVEEDIK
ncbi:MAG: type II toxin-antitoxin system RelE/ParE family toxin [Pyrinomonadaceae bacterium]|nr:type II toxin-antitoxin system RelE/ParE family toxin [Pyrinomonadaceae bacterium]